MTTQSRRGRRLLVLAAGFAVGVVALTPPADARAAQPHPSGSGIYLVTLRAAPLAANDGHLNGLKATAQRSGHPLRVHTPAAQAEGGPVSEDRPSAREQAAVATTRRTGLPPITRSTFESPSACCRGPAPSTS